MKSNTLGGCQPSHLAIVVVTAPTAERNQPTNPAPLDAPSSNCSAVAVPALAAIATGFPFASKLSSLFARAAAAGRFALPMPAKPFEVGSFTFGVAFLTCNRRRALRKTESSWLGRASGESFQLEVMIVQRRRKIFPF